MARFFSLRRLGLPLLADRGGAALIEFALIVPVLSATLLAMVDISLWITGRMAVERAARAGSDYAILHAATYDASAISSAVTSAASQPSYMSSFTADPAPSQWYGCPDAATGVVTAASSTATCANGLAAGTYVTSNARSTLTFILPWAGHITTTTITASSTVRTL